MGWEIFLKALSIVVGIVTGLIAAASQWRNIIPKSRSTLKHDLEILKLLDPSDSSYKTLKDHIDETIRKAYFPRQQSNFLSRVRSKLMIFHEPDFYVGFLLIFIFSALTLYLLKDGFTWLALPAGITALTGIGGILVALQKAAARELRQVATESGTSANRDNKEKGVLINGHERQEAKPGKE